MVLQSTLSYKYILNHFSKLTKAIAAKLGRYILQMLLLLACKHHLASCTHFSETGEGSKLSE